MSISAMKYALEVLENFVEDPRCEAHRLAAIHFLKEAIAEAEKQPVHAIDVNQLLVDKTAKNKHEPWVKTYCGGKPNYTTPLDDDLYDVWKEKNA